MLTMTTEARTAVASITNGAQLAETGGVRIAGDGADQGFALTVAPQPEATDTVVEDSGARVFLDEAAAAALGDQVLDAASDDQGGVRFTLVPQP